jgi:hypothetical protein
VLNSVQRCCRTIGDTREMGHAVHGAGDGHSIGNVVRECLRSRPSSLGG